ncbi:unnamed protein product, partial [Amoebophrya sp. A120]
FSFFFASEESVTTRSRFFGTICFWSCAAIMRKIKIRRHSSFLQSEIKKSAFCSAAAAARRVILSGPEAPVAEVPDVSVLCSPTFSAGTDSDTARRTSFPPSIANEVYVDNNGGSGGFGTTAAATSSSGGHGSSSSALLQSQESTRRPRLRRRWCWVEESQPGPALPEEGGVHRDSDFVKKKELATTTRRTSQEQIVSPGGGSS